jgi:NADPH-dependent glutamate synthase beta subunit-like oxidoreductase
LGQFQEFVQLELKGDRNVDKKEKKQLEVQIKQILYFVENKTEQGKMIAILEEYNNKIPDGGLKDKIQKWIGKTKKDYFDKVDFLVGDIFDGNLGVNEKKIIKEMIGKIRQIIEQAEKSLWEKFINLFNWS